MREPSVRSRRLRFSERWLHDGLLVSIKPAYYQTLEVDFTKPRDLLARARTAGHRITYAQIIVRSTALALAAHPDLHAMLCGVRLHSPLRVDIGLSISASTSVVPILVIPATDQLTVPQIGHYIAARADDARRKHNDMVRLLDRWGWLVPLAVLRRALLRLLFRSFRFRHAGCGTFQVSIVPGMDAAAAPLFNTTAILVAGQVRERVIAVEGEPSVRPTAILTCSADHRVWNGQDGLRFLQTVASVLQSDQIERECLSGGDT